MVQIAILCVLILIAILIAPWLLGVIAALGVVAGTVVAAGAVVILVATVLGLWFFEIRDKRAQRQQEQRRDALIAESNRRYREKTGKE